MKYFYGTGILYFKKWKSCQQKVQVFGILKREKLKQKYPTITDEDLNYYSGKEKEMIELLEYKLGMSKEELRNVIIAL